MRRFALFILCLLPLFTRAQDISKYIVVDQFGYRPVSEKIAVIRDPINGYDASEFFTPGNNYALVNAETGTHVFTGNISSWKGGKVDDSSGDKVWWFDFSSYQEPGTYYILDIAKNVRSYEFVIDEYVYVEVLKHAVRTFYYQRAGYAKEAEFAGANWADGASHLGALQDAQCRKYNDKNNAATERELSGGWYDAGDFNKYTSWTSNYIVDMLRAYEENPLAWGDNYCLPYSENDVPDIVDEVKWGLDHLLKLQEPDGSTISIVSLDGGAPPSSATKPSLYGGVNTSSTLAAAGAYALGAQVFKDLGSTTYSDQLLASAIAAWNWAEANPDVIWKNNSAEYNSVGIGSGQQETDDYGRFAYKIRAATYLYQITNEDKYKQFVENNYEQVHLMLWNFAYPFEQENQEMLLYYSSLSGVSQSVAANIRSTYASAMEGTNNFTASTSDTDPYLAHLSDYVWGSNGVKSRKALMFINYINYGIDPAKDDEAKRTSEHYIHYIHGVNPLSFCYLSNMYSYGADHGVNEFYHTWFGDGTDWDRVGTDPYGPAPGYLVGGPNPSYDWDGCCPAGCGGKTCSTTQRNRLINQPKQKAYDDFNTSWPMNSWSVTENSCGYQMPYIRLLANFVDLTNAPVQDCVVDETVTGTEVKKKDKSIRLYPNPSSGLVHVVSDKATSAQVYNVAGTRLSEFNLTDDDTIDLRPFPDGIYLIQLWEKDQMIYSEKLIKTSND